MDYKDIYELMDKFESSSIAEFEFQSENFSLRLAKAGKPVYAASAPLQTASAAAAPVSAVQAPEAPASGDSITSPLVGTYYKSASPDAEPFVAVGQQVKKGQTVCLIEAMKMINEVPAPCDCIIDEIIAEDGALVEFGQPLFAIKKV